MHEILLLSFKILTDFTYDLIANQYKQANRLSKLNSLATRYIGQIAEAVIKSGYKAGDIPVNFYRLYATSAANGDDVRKFLLALLDRQWESTLHFAKFIDDLSLNPTLLNNFVKEADQLTKENMFKSWALIFKHSPTESSNSNIIERLTADITQNTSLHSFLNDVEYFSLWKGVKHLLSSAKSINFLKSLKGARNVMVHLKGEIKVEIKSYGYRIRVGGYHIIVPLGNLPSPVSGNLGVPDISLPVGYRIENIGTNPVLTGKFHITDIRNYIDDFHPYTAKIDIEVPVGSGFMFPKTGIDGINPESGRSSMFPKNWDDTKTMEEIAYVRARLTVSNLVQGNEYKGLTSGGTFSIGMYVDDLLDFENIGSAFPKL